MEYCICIGIDELPNVNDRKAFIKTLKIETCH